MIDERAYVRFNDGDHVGRAAVRAAFRIQGRGTRVLAFDGTAFRIVHEHLSGFPRKA